jgi:hypothetical protein
MSVIGILKKIFSNYNGQTPSTGKEIEDAFNDNFEEVKGAITTLEDIKIGADVMVLTDPQKQQARDNIGAQASTDNALQTTNKTIPGSINELKSTKVGVESMTLTDPQKQQARSNIGAQATTDNALQTFNKSVVAAINELYETLQGKVDLF